MSGVLPPRRRRRRLLLSCGECRKRKQKCDRGQPCEQCVVRGTESVCTYEKYKTPIDNVSSNGLRLSMSPGSDNISRTESPSSGQGSAILQHAQDLGYSASDPLNSMGMLSQVIHCVDGTISQPAAPLQTTSRIRAQYYNYVRRLPPQSLCEPLFQIFFTGFNKIVPAIDETIFREQAARWWGSAYQPILESGPEALPAELLHFPALLFQVIALGFQFIPKKYDVRLDELKFSPTQTFAALGREYSECGEAVAKVLAKDKPTLTKVQQSLARDLWLINEGELLEAWRHSGITISHAIAINLHLEPSVPPSSEPAELLDALWMNQLRKRVWVNLVCWDNFMAIQLGQPMYINLKECTTTLPIDCETPVDRLSRVPVARSESEKPTALTERIYRYQITARFREIREQERDGPIPRNPEKVMELHDFGLQFRKNLPGYYQASNTDMRWDDECPELSIQRELLSYLVDSYMLALHRPYIFTREKCQRQIYETCLSILESQNRLSGSLHFSLSHFVIGLTFPTFDAAIMLAVVLVSNPERYQAAFWRPHQALTAACDRLTSAGSVMSLAKSGAVILQSTIDRVLEAQERTGGTAIIPATNISALSMSSIPQRSDMSGAKGTASAPSDREQWRFEADMSAMNWTVQDPDFSEFDFSKLDVPIPLKELIWDDALAAQGDVNSSGSTQGIQTAEQGIPYATADQDLMTDVGDNSLWNFLAGYAPDFDDSTA